jgi:hypothetical protein
MFYQVMLGNYKEALSNIRGVLKDNGLNLLELRNQALINVLCDNLQGALEDLNTALQLIADSPRKQINLPGFGDLGPCCQGKPYILSLRGYVKGWMGDDVGAKEDNEAALQTQLQLNTRVLMNSQIDYQMVEKMSLYCFGEFVDLSSVRRFNPSDAELHKTYSPAKRMLKLYYNHKYHYCTGPSSSLD